MTLYWLMLGSEVKQQQLWELSKSSVVNVCQSRGSYIWSIGLLASTQASFYSVTVRAERLNCGWTLLQACSVGIHPFMSKPRPRVSYQPDHPLPSDRDCRATAGHSQPAETHAYCRWLRTKHPQLVQSWGRGGYLFIPYWQKFPKSRACMSKLCSTLVLSKPTGVFFRFCLLKASTVVFRPLLSTMMSFSCVDSLSADQQNTLKVVRASKPRTRKSSKVTLHFFGFLNLFFLFWSLSSFSVNPWKLSHTWLMITFLYRLHILISHSKETLTNILLSFILLSQLVF